MCSQGHVIVSPSDICVMAYEFQGHGPIIAAYSRYRNKHVNWNGLQKPASSEDFDLKKRLKRKK